MGYDPGVTALQPPSIHIKIKEIIKLDETQVRHTDVLRAAQGTYNPTLHWPAEFCAVELLEKS